MKKFFQRKKAAHEDRKNKGGKTLLGILGGTGAIAALAPAAGAAPIEFTGVSTGLNVADAVGTGLNFMGIFGEWTYLVLGVIIAAAVIGFIVWLVNMIPKKGKSKG